MRGIQRILGQWECLGTSYKYIGNKISFRTSFFFHVICRNWSLMGPNLYIVFERAYCVLFLSTTPFCLSTNLKQTANLSVRLPQRAANSSKGLNLDSQLFLSLHPSYCNCSGVTFGSWISLLISQQNLYHGEVSRGKQRTNFLVGKISHLFMYSASRSD